MIYSSIMSCILASMAAVKTRIVAFDTNIVDLTDKCSDPVGSAVRISAGGGTDIDKSVAYCQQFIENPKKTLFFLVTDLEEGGNLGPLFCAAWRRSGSQGPLSSACWLSPTEESPAMTPRWPDGWRDLESPALPARRRSCPCFWNGPLKARICRCLRSRRNKMMERNRKFSLLHLKL